MYECMYAHSYTSRTAHTARSVPLAVHRVCMHTTIVYCSACSCMHEPLFDSVLYTSSVQGMHAAACMQCVYYSYYIHTCACTQYYLIVICILAVYRVCMQLHACSVFTIELHTYLCLYSIPATISSSLWILSLS
jgi:hypothetical protein